jgi:hypothetical protein
MYIILVGSPYTGFTAVGPLQDDENFDAISQWALAKYGRGFRNELGFTRHADWYLMQVYGPTRDYPGGTVVIFGCNLNRPFDFYGPFYNRTDAKRWAEKTWGKRAYHGVFVELEPVKRDEILEVLAS